MKNILLVPIQTDALFLSEDQMVTESAANFSHLPYFNGTRDVNADVANISENIVSKPLQDQNLRLRKGLHLHWALPDALNRGRHLEDGKTEFPIVPNRWLVTRKMNGEEKSWVVESDYLYPEDKQIPADSPMRKACRESITVPVEIIGRESGEQPFRYMGRKISAGEYNQNKSADRYPNLTTVGYGEPSFAAFYPNCHSVFGFHDSEIKNNSGEVTYDVIGWYSDSKQDFFIKLTKGISQEDLNQYLREKANWVLHFSATNSELPTQTLLYSRIKVDTTGFEGKPLERKGIVVAFDEATNEEALVEKVYQLEGTGISIVIGNTGTEALSAYLAKQLETTTDDPTIIEEQLEALYLLDKLDQKVLDLDAKFDEARHENGFNALASGHLWTISIESANEEAADATKEADKPKLPQEIAELLNKTNVLQSKYDRSMAELESLGTQLFADWYKYMMSTYPPEDTRTDYPDIDEVRYFIEEQVMGPLREKEANTGLLLLANSDEISRGTAPASSTGGNSDATAKILAQHINELFLRLNNINSQLPPGSSHFVLKRVGGPRYYEPKEPVVLLVNSETGNPILEPTKRHGQDGRKNDGLLEVHVVQLAEDRGEFYLHTPTTIKKLSAKIETLLSEDSIGYTKWDGQPWNPFRLDWELEAKPLAEGTNLEEKDYEKDLIQRVFNLKSNKPDLEADTTIIADFKGRNPNIYIGKSLLTPQAKRNLYSRLDAYIKENLPDIAIEKTLRDLESYIIKAPKQALIEAAKIAGENKILATALLAFALVKRENLHVLSQVFSGFNDALLQLRQTLQLPIADPIGFLDYQPLTEEVARLAKNSAHLAPQPLTDFNPIRTGQLVINQLRLVDTFGQKLDIDLGKLDRVLGAGPTPTKKVDSKIEVPLQPRLVQPARLNFRWLSASEGSLEMNAVPTTSPICGWILTNQLDDSIVVYSAEGVMLGSIEAEDGGDGLARWNTAPGELHPVFPEAIENSFLRKMVAKIRSGGEEFVANFIDGMDQVLRTIEPEEFESQQALSLLIGRPVALVRASLNLELQGVAAVDQGWKSFYDDRTDADFDRKRDAFTKVEFPVRIGKHDQFNDGLVGFWKEEGNELGEHFYLNHPPLENINNEHLKMLEDDKIPIFQSIDDAPQLVSMLIDPRGSVHVTTGILPVKEINIPAEQYLSSMQRMGVTFLTAPLLSPAANIQSLLPTEEGFQWSWIERQGDTWREVWQYPTIERRAFGWAFADKILAQLIEKNWVQHFFEDEFLFLNDKFHQPLGGQFQPAESDENDEPETFLLDILENISQEQRIEDDSLEFRFSKTKFFEKIMSENNLGDRVWNRLVRSDVGWCQWIPGRPDTFIILPQAKRKTQELEGLGMEFLVEEILQTQSQILHEPRMDANFESAKMTIREGYLKLEMAAE